MKSLLVASALVLFLGSCRTGTTHEYNHWKAIYHPFPGDAAANRVYYHVLNYRPERDGSYWNRLWTDMNDVRLTLQRHILLDNPDNPFLRTGASSKIDHPSRDIPEWED